MTFDATLKEMGRECPAGILAAFDQPPTLPVKLLNVDLSTITRAADLVIGLGEPLTETVRVEFQSSAAASKHADLLVYNGLLFANYQVPVHTVLVLLRPQAAHANMNGLVSYETRPGVGKMEFRYQVVRLWERPAEQLLTGELGVAPLAMLGRLPAATPLETGLTAVAQRLVERLSKESTPERAIKLLTTALLLAGLRVSRNVALRIFRGVSMLEESDTYLMILEQGEERAMRRSIVLVGEAKFGPVGESVRSRLAEVTDIDRLARMVTKAATAANWQEILDTP